MQCSQGPGPGSGQEIEGHLHPQATMVCLRDGNRGQAECEGTSAGGGVGYNCRPATDLPPRSSLSVRKMEVTLFTHLTGDLRKQHF